MLDPKQPLAIYMEGSLAQSNGKMGFGVLRYSPNPVACVVDSEFAGRDAADITRIPRHCPVVATVRDAAALGATAFVLGIAPPGGRVPDAWYAAIDEAVAAGMSVVNGLHDRLAQRYPELRPGQQVWDVRVEPDGIGVGTGAAAGLGNRRVLLVGTDMAIGKMTVGLELHREALRRGIRSAFVATGQIGIVISGGGVALDAVRLDYACGAIEGEVMRHAGSEIVFVEGQGSILHPGSTATLPLLRGTMPTHLVLCHRAGQEHLYRIPSVRIPPLREVAKLYEEIGAAAGAFARPRVVAVGLNTAQLESDSEAVAAEHAIEAETGLPCVDVVRHGAARLLDALGD